MTNKAALGSEISNIIKKGPMKKVLQLLDMIKNNDLTNVKQIW